jgi:Fic family protein
VKLKIRESRPGQIPEEHQRVRDPKLKAELEAANGLRQFDAVRELVQEGLRASPFRLRPSVVQRLNRIAVRGLVDNPGSYRSTDMFIDGSSHQPPEADVVAERVEDMCEYVNGNWTTKSPVHLAAYVMWRLNWIHPFEDGNGRTSRAAAYLVLCVAAGALLPGRNTIPEQIVSSRKAYYDALEAADRADRNGSIDLSAMETLLGDMLAKQLVDLHRGATGAS